MEKTLAIGKLFGGGKSNEEKHQLEQLQEVGFQWNAIGTPQQDLDIDLDVEKALRKARRSQKSSSKWLPWNSNKQNKLVSAEDLKKAFEQTKQGEDTEGDDDEIYMNVEVEMEKPEEEAYVNVIEGIKEGEKEQDYDVDYWMASGITFENLIAPQNTAGLCRMICFVLFLLIGFASTGILLLHFDDMNTSPEIAGAVILALSISCCLSVCCSMCIYMCTWKPKKPVKIRNRHADREHADAKWTLVRINDRYRSRQLGSVTRWKIPHIALLSLSQYSLKKKHELKKLQEQKQLQSIEAINKAIMQGKTVNEIRSIVEPCIFKIHFNGTDFTALREQISFILSIAAKNDQVCIILTSPGGGVSSYGLASNQLMRIRKAGLYLAVCVDIMAASGGYMMACVADEICAAPFSYVGSIGVVASITNYEELLNKHGIETSVFTAGEYKRTVNSVGKMTEEGKAKFKEELEATHRAFKDHVLDHRGHKIKDIDALATGEDWLARDALELGLIDRLCTSDEWLEERLDDFCIVEFTRTRQKEEFFGFDRFHTSLTTWLTTKIPQAFSDFRNRFMRQPRGDEKYQLVPYHHETPHEAQLA